MSILIKFDKITHVNLSFIFRTFTSTRDIRCRKLECKPVQKDQIIDSFDSPMASLEGSQSSSNELQKMKVVAAFLKVFSLCDNPSALFMENNLHEVYVLLLSNRDNDIQQLAFNCLRMYKFPYLLPYVSHFDKILQDSTFKDELMLFTHGGESGVVQPEHRSNTLEILIRCEFLFQNI